MGTAVSGVTFFVQVNTGTASAPIYTTIAGGRNATLSMETATINTTDKDSDNWEENLPGVRSWSLDHKGLLEEDAATQDILWDAYLNHTQCKVQAFLPSGRRLYGLATLTSFSVDGPSEEATINASFKGSGALTKVD